MIYCGLVDWDDFIEKMSQVPRVCVYYCTCIQITFWYFSVLMEEEVKLKCPIFFHLSE
jgi:hypothetical protein